MKFTRIHIGIALVLGLLLGIVFSKVLTKKQEGFSNLIATPTPNTQCKVCNKLPPCAHATAPAPAPVPSCPPSTKGVSSQNNPCREPDLSKYVLKSTVPPPIVCPDMSNYMLKTECPPVPDLSKYVLKSSIQKPQPVILDCSKCQKPKGECPPCPRPRCPEVMCPEPTKCPPPAPCPRPVCPAPVVKCRTEEPVQNIRPFLAPLSTIGFGLA
uniref:Uncharacterized protein n=1 Tax=viral metagenome TaxID=1070528 RepID=A0A6C0IA78_9ZZZZ